MITIIDDIKTIKREIVKGLNEATSSPDDFNEIEFKFKNIKYVKVEDGFLISEDGDLLSLMELPFHALLKVEKVIMRLKYKHPDKNTIDYRYSKHNGWKRRQLANRIARSILMELQDDEINLWRFNILYDRIENGCLRIAPIEKQKENFDESIYDDDNQTLVPLWLLNLQEVLFLQNHLNQSKK